MQESHSNQVKPFPDHKKHKPKKCKTKKQLCIEYGICPNTLKAWILLIEDKMIAAGYHRSQKTLTPKQVQILEDAVGEA